MYLKQSTASQSRSIGPFVDDTDFKTAETGLTIANTDIKLMANGAASANKNSGGGTHRVNGFYGVTFDATDTATVGELQVSVVVAGALPVYKTFFVLEEAVYDMLFGASAQGYITDQPVNTTKIGGTSQTARDIGASVLLSNGTGTGQISLSSGLVTPTTAAIASIFTTAVTEAYRADGAAPTLAQALCEILGHLGESSISGTTKTVKQFDGSTTAATFTLNDATTPTSITRAT